jgi:hypothetical protein
LGCRLALRIRSEFAGEPSRHLIDSCVSRLSAINDKTVASSAKPRPFNSIIISQSWRTAAQSWRNATEAIEWKTKEHEIQI